MNSLTQAPAATGARTRSRIASGGILVLGGGFAGSHVARGVGSATVVNPNNYMLYTPLLPEAAAGSIEPRHAVVPLRAMAPDADVVLGSVLDVDTRRRVVEVGSEVGRVSIAYAELVLALGSVTRMPPVPGLAENAVGLKTLSDAVHLRNHVLRQIELADASPDTARRRLTFVVAGGGFAGVETIAELHELVAETVPRHPRLRGVRPRWVLVDAAPRILGETPERLAGAASAALAARGIEILTATSLRSVDAASVELSDGRRIDAETLIWTAGVTANPLVGELGLPVDERGRVEVDETLRVNGVPHVWALGDCAAVPNGATPERLDPPTCQHALRQARQLVENLRGAPRPYRYRSRGQMATLGSRNGIALVGRLPVSGLLGWLIARGYHLLQLPFHSRRARVFADWVSAALFRRDIAELSSLENRNGPPRERSTP